MQHQAVTRRTVQPPRRTAALDLEPRRRLIRQAVSVTLIEPRLPRSGRDGGGGAHWIHAGVSGCTLLPKMVAAQIHDADDRPEPRQHVGYRHLRTETVHWMKCARSNHKEEQMGNAGVHERCPPTRRTPIQHYGRRSRSPAKVQRNNFLLGHELSVRRRPSRRGAAGA